MDAYHLALEFPALQMKFPVTAQKFPVLQNIFPVSLSRELVKKPLGRNRFSAPKASPDA
jgi:hypothetical protein